MSYYFSSGISVLNTDNGEQDPEIYLDIPEKCSGWVMVIYIRYVHSDARKREIDEMTKGLDIILMEDSHKALDHTRSKGWIR